MATYGGGFFRFHDGRFTQFSRAEGLPSEVVLDLLSARDGSLWLTTPYGVTRMRDGHFRNYTTVDGLSSSHPGNLYEDRRGTIWVATPGGIDRFAGDRFVAIDKIAGAQNYKILGEDSKGGLYATASPGGIVRIYQDKLISVTNRLNVWGMLRRGGDLWFCGDGVYRADVNALQRWEHDHESPLDYSRFGPSDGLTAECGVGLPDLAVTRNQKLWAATLQGLAQLDLSRVRKHPRKAQVYLEEITVGGKRRSPGNELILSPGPHHVELHFGVIELASPEKIRMQYRMDDVDQEWVDTGPTGTGIYSTLPIGVHNFHVRACNSDGIWDREGITYRIRQLPYFYETTFFRLMTVATIALLLVAVYRFRFRRLMAEMNARLDERVSERTRLAREFHDTLLQTIQGSKMVADDGLENAADPAHVYRALTRVSTWLARATEEGRAALTALRFSGITSDNLTDALQRAGEDSSFKSSLHFALTVEGTVRDIHPIVRDEVYLIAYEAIRNAFTHSKGTHVEVDLRYTRDFTLRVRDNGIGLDLVLAARGKKGHFGIQGMEERARQIGARLKFHSTNPGTTVVLTVPGYLIYPRGKSRVQRSFIRLRRLLQPTK